MFTFFILGVPAFLAAAFHCRRSAAAIPWLFSFFCWSPKALLGSRFDSYKKIPKEPASFSPPPSREPLPKWRNLLYKVLLLQPKRHIHQYNQRRNFHQRTNNTRKGLPTIDSKNTNRYRNRQLEVVPCRRKG